MCARPSIDFFLLPTRMEELVAAALRPITLEQALRSYRALKETDGPHAGLQTLDRLFLPFRIQTKTSKGRGRVSFLDCVNTPRLLELVRRYKRYQHDPTRLSYQYNVFQVYHGSVNQFLPQVAKSIYQRYQPSSILDFSAGWGGRALAAMALGIPYTGVDSNTQLKEPYERLAGIDPLATVRMLFQPAESVDFSKLSYDMVFTSPPYALQEVYQGMPDYQTLDTFLATFFHPVITRVWEHLQPGGVLCLNLPVWLFERLPELPEVTEREPMPFRGRKGVERQEWVYVWRKLPPTRVADQ